MEWFQDPQGARVNPGQFAATTTPLTGGVNYKPHANITIRPEIRYDTFNSFASFYRAPVQQRPVELATQNGGFDMIFTY